MESKGIPIWNQKDSRTSIELRRVLHFRWRDLTKNSLGDALEHGYTGLILVLPDQRDL